MKKEELKARISKLEQEKTGITSYRFMNHAIYMSKNSVTMSLVDFCSMFFALTDFHIEPHEDKSGACERLISINSELIWLKNKLEENVDEII